MYLSDSKVDMLAPQVPTSLRSKVAAELKVDLKVVALTLKENPSPENQYARTRMVIEHLRTSGAVGTVEAPLDYFAGTLGVRWGPWKVNKGMVYFSGTQGDVTVGLGGSMGHVIGGKPQGSSEFDGFSSLPLIIEALMEDREQLDEWEERLIPQEIVTACREMAGPLERVTFVARTLLAGEEGASAEARRTVVLGSPIYVAAGGEEL